MKKANTKYNVNELIKNRWSPRSFSDEKIPEKDLLSLFEAASWAASSRNEQPWRFIYGMKGEGANYQKILNVLVEWNQNWAKTAPVLILGVAKLNSDHKNLPNAHAHYDLGQAVTTMALQAIDKNIYMHQMGGFDASKAHGEFNIPEGYEVMVAIAVGYIGEPESLDKDLRELEEKARSRLDLSKIIFDGDFKP